MSAGKWLSSARAAGFTSVEPASSHLTAASCAMTKSIGQMAREPITTRIFKILRGISDRLLGSARAFRTSARLRYRRETWLSAQRPGIMTDVVYRVEPAGRDLTDSANIGVTDEAAAFEAKSAIKVWRLKLVRL